MTEQSVGIVGVGRLGSDVALTLAERDLCDIVLYDAVAERAEYLAADLSDTSFGHVYNRRVSWVSQLSDLASCDAILVAAGRRRTAGTSAAELFSTNRRIAQELADAFVGSSTVFVVASEPVDLMTAELTRALRVPPFRVLGIGGVVDSFRVRHALGEALSVSPDFIRCHVIGPHTEALRVLWDYTSINGVPIRQLADESLLNSVAQRVAADSDARVQRMGAAESRYAPAIACFDLLRSLVKDDRRIMSVTIDAHDILGLSGVAVSIPCVVGRFGADRPVVPPLDEEDRRRLAESAEARLGALGSVEEVR